jgi:hypothetical protein
VTFPQCIAVDNLPKVICVSARVRSGGRGAELCANVRRNAEHSFARARAQQYQASLSSSFILFFSWCNDLVL